MQTYVYETNGGYQVDAPWGSYVFAPSRLQAGPAVECREYYPETPETRERALEALEAGRANGLPI